MMTTTNGINKKGWKYDLHIMYNESVDFNRDIKPFIQQATSYNEFYKFLNYNFDKDSFDQLKLKEII